MHLLIFIGVVLAGTITAAIIHEAGHALATMACGGRLRAFVLGIGPTVLQFQIGSTLFSLKAAPITGHIARDLTNKRWTSFAITVAGPMANALALGFVFFLWRLRPDWGLTLLIFGIYEALFFVTTLLPLTRNIDGVKIGSDGMRLFDLLFRYKAGTFA